MALIVQKFGGTSVGSLERIQAVADKVADTKAQGHSVVVVVSAMSGETDRLIQMAKAIACDAKLTAREYDSLVSTGEQVSMNLVSMALIQRGLLGRSFTGSQAGIKTSADHKKARIMSVDNQPLLAAIESGYIPVVAGFQGINPMGDVTTLGRGGSDTTAVALAAALNADECQIYTDVDGVYTTDPRVVSRARRLERITFEEMLEMASLGAKVLQIRSVEFAGKYNVPLRVLSSFKEGAGTLITYENSNMEHALVSGIAFDRNQAKLTLVGVPESSKAPKQIFAAISDANIDVDMIVQNSPTEDKRVDFSFTVQRDDYKEALAIVEQLANKLEAKGVLSDDKIVKLSIVGVGMRSHSGVATQMFTALADEGITVQLVSTSEIKISVIVDEKYLELGVRSLHTSFGLDGDPKEE